MINTLVGIVFVAFGTSMVAFRDRYTDSTAKYTDALADMNPLQDSRIWFFTVETRREIRRRGIAVGGIVSAIYGIALIIWS